MTVVVVILLVVGVLLELAGLRTILQDLDEAGATAQRIKRESENKAGIRHEIMVGWITEMAGVAALPRRKRGLGLIVLGLVAQTVANLIALWT
jgi:hypothetical protein